MDSASPDKPSLSDIRLMLRRDAGRALLLSLLAVAMLPALLIGIAGDRSYSAHVEAEIPHVLHRVATLKRSELRQFLETRLADAAVLADEPSTRAFFNTLAKRHADAFQAPEAFVQSPVWATTVSAFDAAIQLHADLHGYSDILLIDARGDVIYTSARGPELGKNIDTTMAGADLLAKAVKKTLKAGERGFTGFFPYPTNDGPMTAFITAPIASGPLSGAGVLACRIPGDAVDHLLQPTGGGTDGLQVYLIDADLAVVAGSAIPREHRRDIGGPLPALWRKRRQAATVPSNPVEPATYRDAGNRSWTGFYEPLDIDGHRYAVIVEMDRQVAFAAITRLRQAVLTVIALTVIAVVLAAAMLGRRYVIPPHGLARRIASFPASPARLRPPTHARNDVAYLTLAFEALMQHIDRLQADNDTRVLLLSGLTCLHQRIGGESDLNRLYLPALDSLSEFLGLQWAAFYTVRDDGSLERVRRIPDRPDTDAGRIVLPGEGPVGLAALDQTIAAYRTDAISALLTAVPKTSLGNLVAVPLTVDRTLIGALELEKPTIFTPSEAHFVEAAAEVIAVVLNAALIRREETRLRRDIREQARQLKMREAALEASGTELISQKRAFQNTEHHLQLKQLELQAANAQMAKNAGDLEANLAILEKQQQDMQQQNAALAQAHRDLAEKARQLEISSRYKSEFMANMSHELRTPLNSILLLSRLLMENKEQTLTERQFEYTRTIYSAGEDLLNLINEILDLSKVEAGKMEMKRTTVAVADIAGTLEKAFTPLAEQKGLDFGVHVDPMVPPNLTTDRKRLEQILKNFLSNAFKFTESGSVRLAFAPAGASGPEAAGPAGPPEAVLAISVTDTGIGIPAGKQAMIFEAFQQVDGSTRRKYEGTGLGLSISRELARMLRGRIMVESREGDGSRFTLLIPMSPKSPSTSDVPAPAAVVQHAIPPGTPDPAAGSHRGEAAAADPTDPFDLTPESDCILVIDHQAATTGMIAQAINPDGCRLLRATALPTAFHFADYYRPEAIFISLDHPGVPGWSVIRQIKTVLHDRSAPVFGFSPVDGDISAIIHGAAGHLQTPATPDSVRQALDRMAAIRKGLEKRTVLVLSPSAETTARVKRAIDGGPFRVHVAAGVDPALKMLTDVTADALIVDPAITMEAARDLSTALRRRPIPLLCYPDGAAARTLQKGFHLAGLELSLPPIGTDDRLLALLTSDLHLPSEALDDTQRDRLSRLDRRDAVLAGRKVLLADDDMRTVFAVSSVLENWGVEVITGKSGKESLDKLGGFPEIDLVLLDVLMAGVDDYQAIRQVRRRVRYRSIPVIALTARAMTGDRARCLAAGADDYLSKPVNSEKLTSMLTFWLDPQLTAPPPSPSAAYPQPQSLPKASDA